MANLENDFQEKDPKVFRKKRTNRIQIPEHKIWKTTNLRKKNFNSFQK